MIIIVDNRTDEVLDEIHDQDKILEAEHVQDAESKEETLDFVFNGSFDGIVSRNRLLIKDDDNEYREFIIENIDQVDEEISVFANASYLEDLNNGQPTGPANKNQMTTAEWVDFALRGTDWYPGDVEYNGVRSMSWTGYNNPYELLTMVANTFSMTLRFRVEVESNRVVGRYVDLVKVNHLFKGKEIVRGKDLVEFKRSENTEELATALIALGPQPEEGKERLVEVVVDDEANEKINKQGKYNWRIYEPQSDDQSMTVSRLRTLATTELNKRKEPAIDYEITAVNLEHLYGHERVRLYDKVRIKDEELDRYAEANTKKITRNLLDPTDRVFVFGDIIEYQRETLRAYFNSIINELKQRLDNMPNTVDNIIEIIENSELFERNIVKSETPPLNPQEGDFWLDISDSEVGVLYRWENGKWVKSSVTQAEEIGAVTREAAMYDSIKNTLELLTMQHSVLMNEYYNTMNNEYFVDNDLKASLTSAFEAVDGIFTAVNNRFNEMTIDTATMGRLMTVLELITDYRRALNAVRVRLIEAQREIERYFRVLQSQYSEEKYNEILNEVAEKFGLEVVDGKLVGDAIFIENMNAIKKDLQDQLDAARERFDNLEVGGRNYITNSKNGIWLWSNNGITQPYDNEEFEEYHLYKTLEPSDGISSYSNIWVDHPEGTKHMDSVEVCSSIDTFIALGIKDLQNERFFLPANTWKRIYTERVATGESVRILGIRTDRPNPEGVKYRKYMNHLGHIPMDWTAAPEDNDGKITSINQQLINIEGRLASTVDQTTYDTLKKTVTDQGTLLEQTASGMQAKADKSVVDTINGTVREQGTLLNQTAEALRSKAEQKELNEVQGTVQTQQTLIDQNSRDIAIRAKTEDLNTLTGRVSRAEGSISLNSKELATKLNAATYQTDKEGIVGRLSGAESTLTQQAKLIETKVGSTELTQAIGDIEVGVRNLVLNSEFNLTTANYLMTNFDTSEPLVIGEKYTITIYGSLGEDRVSFSLFTADGYSPFLSLEGYSTGGNLEEISEGVYQSTFIHTDHIYTTSHSKFRIYQPSVNNSDASTINKIKIEKGTIGTDWTAAPEDEQAELNALEERIITHDTKFEQTDKQIALRATMTDVNKSDETLSRALSEMIVSSTGGLKFQWDSNGRLESYSVGPDGIQFDGSKIRFRAQDSIMLQISNAEKAGLDAQKEIDNIQVGGDNLLSNSEEYLKKLGSNFINIGSGFGRGVYTVSFDYDVIIDGSSFTNFLVYADGTLGHALRRPNGSRTSFTFELDDSKKNSAIYLYAGSNAAESKLNEVKFLKVKLEEGNVSTGWDLVGRRNLISAINLDDSGVQISGRKIDLVGDVYITNGKTVISNAFIDNVRVKYLYSSNENNNLQLTANGMVMRNASGQLDIGTTGLVYKDTAGKVRYRMDQTFVSSAALGTTNANVYLATDVGYEVRFVDVSQVPSDGLVNSYRYVDFRGKVGYVGGLANNPAITTHLDLGADGEVRIMNNGRTTYGAARAAAVYAHSFNWSTDGNNSSNLYIRPSSAGEVRFTAIHTTENYSDIRAARVYSDSVWSHRFADYWIRVDGEVILSAHGSTSNYRDIRGMFARFDALDVNTGTHIYTRPYGASAELRVTARGTTDQYRDLRFRNWTSVSSEKYKTDITEWNYNVLDIIKNDLKIYQYKYKDDVDEGDNVMYQRGLILERETPSEFIKGDGINQYEVTSWTLKAVQELAHENDALKEKVSDLEKRLNAIEKMLK